MNLFWLDVETTGLAVDSSAIIEFAVILTDPRLREISRHEWLVMPAQHYINAMDRRDKARFVRDRVGFNEAAWLRGGAVSFGEILPTLCDLARGCKLAGHCVGFDKDFFEDEAARGGVELRRILGTHRTLDTASLAYPMITAGRIPDAALWRLCEWFGVPNMNPHRAMSDVEATLGVARHLLRRHEGVW